MGSHASCICAPQPAEPSYCMHKPWILTARQTYDARCHLQRLYCCLISSMLSVFLSFFFSVRGKIFSAPGSSRHKTLRQHRRILCRRFSMTSTTFKIPTTASALMARSFHSGLVCTCSFSRTLCRALSLSLSQDVPLPLFFTLFFMLYLISGPMPYMQADFHIRKLSWPYPGLQVKGQETFF